MNTGLQALLAIEMTLSAEQLQALLGQETPQPTTDTDTRREAPRVTLGRRARILSLADASAAWSRVMLHDISVKGVGFLAQAPIKVGDRFVLDLVDAAGKPVYLECTARRCERGGIGGVSHVIGATFNSQLEPHERPVAGQNAAEPRRRIAATLRHTLALLNPLRLLLHGFRRFDDYSSLDDTKWFRRPS